MSAFSAPGFHDLNGISSVSIVEHYSTCGANDSMS